MKEVISDINSDDSPPPPSPSHTIKLPDKKSIKLWLPFIILVICNLFISLMFCWYFPDTNIKYLGILILSLLALLGWFFGVRWLNLGNKKLAITVFAICCISQLVTIIQVTPQLVKFTLDPHGLFTYYVKYQPDKVSHYLKTHPKYIVGTDRNLQHGLIIAIKSENLPLVRLISQRTNKNTQPYATVTAAEVRSRDILQYLVDQGFVFSTPEVAILILQDSIKNLNVDWIDFLIQLGVNPEANGFFDSLNQTHQQIWSRGIMLPAQRKGQLLLQYLRRNNRDRIPELLTAPIDLTIRDNYDFQALTYAILDLNLFKKLISLGANINTFAYSKTPFIVYAVESQKQELLSYILSQKVTVDQPTQTGLTAIVIAANMNDLKTVQQLIQYGANVFQVDPKGRPLEDITTSKAVRHYILQEKRLTQSRF